MNRQLGEPLVIKTTGGRGGGARLSPAGEQAIVAFRELDRAFREFIDRRTRTLVLERDRDAGTAP